MAAAQLGQTIDLVCPRDAVTHPDGGTSCAASNYLVRASELTLAGVHIMNLLSSVNMIGATRAVRW